MYRRRRAHHEMSRVEGIFVVYTILHLGGHLGLVRGRGRMAYQNVSTLSQRYVIGIDGWIPAITISVPVHCGYLYRREAIKCEVGIVMSRLLRLRLGPKQLRNWRWKKWQAPRLEQDCGLKAHYQIWYQMRLLLKGYRAFDCSVRHLSCCLSLLAKLVQLRVQLNLSH